MKSTSLLARQVFNQFRIIFISIELYIQFCSKTFNCAKNAKDCGLMIESGFDQFVGLSALTGELVSSNYCLCKDDAYGPICDKTLEQFEEFYNCGNYGIFDDRNSVTGCSCRESIDGNATEYHGWYCEIHNR